MTQPLQSPLGQPTAYASQFDAALLFPIERAPKRTEIGIGQVLPFLGADLWTSFELSWLNMRGKPQVALAHFTVPCETPNLIESKSLKLYLNSLNDTRFESPQALQERLRSDLSEALWRNLATHAPPSTVPALPGASMGVRLVLPEHFDQEQVAQWEGLSLDRLDVECTQFTPAPALLRTQLSQAPVSEVLCSNLLKSNCLVTGQPDWASVQISYSGAPIEQAGLLQYLVSFRNHPEFHEQCVERIFMDIWSRCKPIKLAVYARYTRRGGLDINPFRTSYPQALPRNTRSARQ